MLVGFIVISESNECSDVHKYYIKKLKLLLMYVRCLLKSTLPNSRMLFLPASLLASTTSG